MAGQGGQAPQWPPSQYDRTVWVLGARGEGFVKFLAYAKDPDATGCVFTSKIYKAGEEFNTLKGHTVEAFTSSVDDMDLASLRRSLAKCDSGALALPYTVSLPLGYTLDEETPVPELAASAEKGKEKVHSPPKDLAPPAAKRPAADKESHGPQQAWKPEARGRLG
ncbi:hypothetical protein WJX73_001492 [Symbiochloris irregularis]|uniref:Uncharacterized protein n=1 Tax=Symbiochloris irregularis TaxID=706552 RepID=A0AAW1P8A3_9CHLO